MKPITTSTLKDLLCAGLYDPLNTLHFKCVEIAHRKPLYSHREVFWYWLSGICLRFATWLYHGSNMECNDAQLYTHDEIPDEELSPRALNARYGREG